VPEADDARPVRVALDLLGGDGAPEVVADAVRLLAEASAPASVPPGLELVLVGTPDLVERLMAERGLAGRYPIAAASGVVAMHDAPVRAVRSDPEVSVQVATDLVRSGQADAAVTIGSTGAAVAASLFSLGTLPGLARPALAVSVPAVAGPVLLLDAGATPERVPQLLVQHALLGAAQAGERLGVARPRVGLLAIGQEPAKGDVVRRTAHGLLAALPDGLALEFVGNVEGREIGLGGVDVVVTDGFTGNVALKATEGALGLALAALSRLGHAEAARALAADLGPEQHAGALLLGVEGVVVIGHGASTPRSVASAVRLAAEVAASDLTARAARRFAALVAAVPPAQRQVDPGRESAGAPADVDRRQVGS
jgi:phosphate acyltransferase